MEETITNAGSFPTLTSIRAAARGALKGHWTNAVLCTLVFLLVACVASSLYSGGSMSKNNAMIAVGYAIILLVTMPLSYGYQVALLHHMRGMADDDLVTRPFAAFKQYGRYLGTSLLVVVFTFLWTLLLIVPGIVKAYAYAMTPYVMADRPELSANECIDFSRKMMKGYKWKLFCLDLSFIGWMLLCVLTLGIGTLWLEPYMYCSRAKFYEELKVRQASAPLA